MFNLNKTTDANKSHAMMKGAAKQQISPKYQMRLAL
jgi:hypothetical protein